MCEDYLEVIELLEDELAQSTIALSKSIEKRVKICAENVALRKQRNALEAACKIALNCIARLTPFPMTSDPMLLKAISETADYADSVRDQLRAAILSLEKDETIKAQQEE